MLQCRFLNFAPRPSPCQWGKNGRERNNALLVEHEENRHHETNEGSQVVPAEVVLENNDGEERKHRKRDALLDDLELNETERAAVAFKPDAVGRHHEAVFKESDRPGKKHDGGHALKLMTFMVWSFKCKYQAQVMKMLETQRRPTARRPLLSIGTSERTGKKRGPNT